MTTTNTTAGAQITFVPPDPRRLRKVVGTFPTGVTVITTTTDDGDPYGMTANSFTSVSLNPALVLVCLRRGSRLITAITRRQQFGINILDHSQEVVARHFADPLRRTDDYSFGPEERFISESGIPFIRGAIAHLECRLYAMHPGGDHVVCVGEILGTNAAEGHPLTFVTGRFTAPALPC